MTAQSTKVTIADLVHAITEEPLPLRITAYDGSDVGPADAEVRLHVVSELGLRYIMSAPGDLGLARAYLSGQLEAEGVPPGNPYEVLRLVKGDLTRRRPSPREIARVVRGLGIGKLNPPPPPPQERLPRWRRGVEAVRQHSNRAADSISHHYDVSNRFYELVLGPSMTYTCAVFRKPDTTLDQAQEDKYALVAGKLGLTSGMTLLDVGCGWGGMVRHAAREHGVKAIGVTLSKQQAVWGQEAIEREGLSDLAEVRHLDYRQAPEREFDAISSIGLTEHIGVRNYPEYFGHLHRRLKTGGRLLNHCITRPDGSWGARPDAFTDRYVFPDGELAAPGRLVTEVHDAGFEVQHEENLRMHYAKTLQGWCENLQDNWDECVDEVGEGRARVWGLYMAGSRVAFELNNLQLHQVLATKPGADGGSSYPLRPDWDPLS
jgi:cyclopropane-fatty-acyl-phospholipid synthase